MIYGIPEQTNNTPQPGEVSLQMAWLDPTLKTLLEGFKIFMNAKYPSQANQVLTNPYDAYSNQMFQMYLMSLQNQNNNNSQPVQQQEDKTLLYVALAALAAVAVVTLTNNDNRSRRR